jgi:TolB-like protein/Tfp pilus assembly protein PilF
MSTSAKARHDVPNDERFREVLVVLPFANVSGNSEDEHFSDGLTDELIGTIGKLSGIAVVGRTSAFAFKGQPLDLAAIGSRVNATSIVEGSVRRFGQRFKIGVQLVRVSDAVVLWSEIYERDATDFFAVQTEIARSVSAALHLRLDPAATKIRPGSGDPIAQDFYLRGRFFLNRVSAEDLRQSIACFEQAVERDPMFARAYAGLADARLVLAIMGHAAAAPEVARVHAALARALALDGDLAEAHTSLASVLFAFDWKWTDAEREFTTAIRLDPGYGLAHHRYGLFLMYQLRYHEAQCVLEAARTADPLAASVNMNLGRLHLSAHRPERAIPLLLTATELSPQLALAHEQLGYTYLELNSADDALREFRHVARLTGPRGATRLAYALAVTGDRGAARELVRGMAERPDAVAHAFGLALASTGLGELDNAFAWLHRAYIERDPFLHTIKALPAFRPLHGDSRWLALLTRIGLT